MSHRELKVGRAAMAAAVVTALVVGATTSGASARTAASTVEFRPVLRQLPPTTGTATPDATTAAMVAGCDVDAVEQLPVVPTTRWRAATAEHCVVFPDFVDTTRRYYLGPAGVTPDAVRRARAEFVTGQGWTVRLTLTRAGSRAWDALAEQQFHHQVAITASGKVVSAPIIQPNDATFESFGGTAVISGSFNRKQAEAVAILARPPNGR
jgi:hypothetical protein